MKYFIHSISMHIIKEKEQIVFDEIVIYIQKYCKSPTYRYLQHKLWYKHVRSIAQFLEQLQKKNLIKINKWKIELLNSWSDTVNIPICWVANIWLPLRIR